MRVFPAIRMHRQAAVLAILLAMCARDLRGQDVAGALRNIRLDVIISSSLFPAANRNDATAALKVWSSVFGRRRGFLLDPAVHVVDDDADARKRILAGPIGILALNSSEYFRMSDLSNIEPLFSAERGHPGTPFRYLLLVRNDGNYNSLESLRGKRIMVFSNNSGALSVAWLESLMQEARLGPSRRFFQSITVTSKPSGAILPLFFSKVEAAIVDLANFDITKEMNPQLGRQLRVMATSPNIVEGLVCLNNKDVTLRGELVAGIRDLHLDAEGRQILLVLRCRRLIPLDKAALRYTRELWQNHQALLTTQDFSPKPGARP